MFFSQIRVSFRSEKILLLIMCYSLVLFRLAFEKEPCFYVSVLAECEMLEPFGRLQGNYYYYSRWYIIFTHRQLTMFHHLMLFEATMLLSCGFHLENVEES